MSIYERFEKHADRTFAEAATRYLSELAQHYASPDVARLLAHAEKVCERRDTTMLRSVG